MKFKLNSFGFRRSFGFSNITNIAKKAVCLFLIVSLLTLSAPAAPQIISESSSSRYQGLLIYLKTNDLWEKVRLSLNVLQGTAAFQKQESQEDRDALVADIKIQLKTRSIIAGSSVSLDALPVDSSDNAIPGVRFEWEAEDQNGTREALPEGIFNAKQIGNYTIFAKGANREASIQVQVVPWQIDELSESKLKEREQRQILRRYDEWDIENIPLARKPRNERGNPPGKPKENSNYNIAAPVLSIPGRGLDLELSLYYNSRLWSRLDQDVSFDMDKDWLSPGWTLGFGKIINMVAGGIAQTDADGTRRFYAGTIDGTQPDKITFIGQSTDGKFIKSRTVTSKSANCYFNPITYVKHPNGSTIKYEQLETSRSCFAENEPITMVPIEISDRHGNQIKIVYHDPSINQTPGRWINYIKDTLGRVYTFNYTSTPVDGRYLLTDITGPSHSQNGNIIERTFVRLNYASRTLSYNFGSLIPHTASNNIKVISGIYYPATGSGYWFNDTDSYSPYGMIRKVKEQRGMSFTQGSNGGTISNTSAQTTRERVYSYPQNTSTALNDIPTFGTVTDTWEKMTEAPVITSYEINWDSTPRTTKITGYDNSYTIEYSYNLSNLADTDPEKIKDGLTYKTEFFTQGGISRSTDEIEWELGYNIGTTTNPVNIPRLKSVTRTEIENGITLTTKTISDVFGDYNQIKESREIGYNGTTDVLRKTKTTFVSFGENPQFDNEWRALPRLLNLPSEVEILDGSTRVDYIKYDYDLTAAEALSSTNPTNFCGDAYCNSITQRGNNSKTTKYAKASDLTNAVIENWFYDKVGNLVRTERQNSGIQQTIAKFLPSTSYAFPMEVSKGNPGSSNTPQFLLKTESTYDVYKSLPLSVKDVNQQLTAASTYDPNTWQLTRIDAPTGAYTLYDYNDATRVNTKTQYTVDNKIAGKVVSKINGLGQVYRQETFTETVTNTANGQTTEVFDVIETEYDQQGRTKRTSNPFRSNVSTQGVYWSTNVYDWAGRIEKTVSPDGSEKLTFYNESARPQGASTDKGKTFRIKDPAGRQRWYRTDADENIVEVIEPNPDGDGSVTTGGLLTKYEYDKLKHITRTEQATTQNGQQFIQERRFQYDSLGRMTQQKLAEAQATLDDSGAVSSGISAKWSHVFKYDEYSNVTSMTDARGVETKYFYIDPANPQWSIDPLNRLFKISYDTHGAANVLSSPDVTYTYQPPASSLAQLKTVTVNGVSTEVLEYDSFGRLSWKETTLTTRPDQKLKTTYVYDSLSRVIDVIYPQQHGFGGALSKDVHYDYDNASRLSALKVDNVNYASNFAFNAFNQVKSVNIGASGINQITESFDYNPQTGLLENQKVTRGATSLLDLTYQYQQCSCSTGGAGQIIKIVNNLDRNRDRHYEYDALSRLKKVTGGINQTWSQTYSYDRYGNRKGVSTLGFESLASESENGETDEQKKIISESLSLSAAPTAEKLLKNVADLTDKNKLEGSTAPSLSPFKQNAEVGIKNRNDRSEAEAPIERKAQDQQSNENFANAVSTTPGTPFNFDTDSKADFAVWRRATTGNNGGAWSINRSVTGQTTTTQLGSANDQIAPGDYDGDGKTDEAVWTPSSGDWTIRYSSTGTTGIKNWGSKGDSIVPADYDGDGKTDVAVWRPSTGYWYIVKSSDNGWYGVQYGNIVYGDIPAVGDYDGDGKADITVWRPSNGTFYYLRSSDNQSSATNWGLNGDVPVPAKYDYDAKTDFAVWRPSNGTWYVLLSSAPGQYTATNWGSESLRDVLAPADYDGDGRTDVAVWRASSGFWYVIRSSDNQMIAHQLGTSDHVPVPSAYIRRSSAPRGQSVEIPRDGHESLSFDPTSNRITTTGFGYDAAGNQTQIVQPDGRKLLFQYDAAGRLIKVRKDTQGSVQTMVTYTYGVSRERLIAQEGDENSTYRTYYVWDSGNVIAEYIDSANNTLAWSKNYIYTNGALLATQEKFGTGERLLFTHSDRLGARIITNPADGTSFEQATLPYGTALESETTGSINRRFTSYDRNENTKLDYAVNRFYDSAQGRFTTVDPLGIEASNLLDPQSLNLYAYCGNDPINRVDPDGQFWGFISAVVGFARSLFSGTRFNFNIRVGNSAPFNFSFSGAFRNIYAGYAGYTIQLTGRDSIFNSFNNPFDCSSGVLQRVNVKDNGSDKAITNYNYFYLHKDVVPDFNAAIKDITDRINQQLAGPVNRLGKHFIKYSLLLQEFGFNELFRTFPHQKKLYDAYVARGRTPPIAGNPANYPPHLLGAAFDINEAIQLQTIGGKTIRAIFESHNFRWFGSDDRPHFTHKNFIGLSFEKRKEIASQVTDYFNNCTK